MRNVGEKEKNGEREMNIIVIVVVVLWYVD